MGLRIELLCGPAVMPRRQREQQAIAVVGPDPAEAIDWRDVQILLEAEIARLPQRYRAAFVLCHLEGRSRVEAAADLGIEENTLSSRIGPARAAAVAAGASRCAFAGGARGHGACE